jgi:putative Mg2+ transporter-C (MgtC) family protein
MSDTHDVLSFVYMDMLLGPLESQFLIGLTLSVVLGFMIGAERESRGKDAGISTHILVVGGSMLFTFLSALVDPMSTSRIAAQIVTGIGFLGAGLILKEGHSVHNLTTAASLWYAAAVGMAIGFGFYAVAAIAGIIGVLVPRIPSIGRKP